MSAFQQTEATNLNGGLHEASCQSCGTPLRFEINHEIEPLMERWSATTPELGTSPLVLSPKRSCSGKSFCCTQIGLGPLVATNTSKKVAVLRTFPAIVMSGSDRSGCPQGEKKMVWHEVWSDITATSFTQTGDMGEVGGPLKRALTIHAVKASTEATGVKAVPQ